jgi:crossover junction endodeoxyribonuclease RusA
VTRHLTTFIPGMPASQGSKKLIRGRLIDTDRNLHQWRTRTALQVRAAANGHRWPRGMPVALRADFRLPRPARPAYTYPPRRDLDKLLRALCDALTQSEVIADDSQIVRITATKTYVGAALVGVQLAIRCEVD